MRPRKRAVARSVAVAAVAVAAAVTVSTALADPVTSSPTNPGQVDGPGIITIEQLNMCMWGSEETPSCFTNDAEPGSDAWTQQETRAAASKRDSMVAQYQRHIPDVLTVNEGCLNDLQAVADQIGYDLRYEDTGDGTDGKPRQCSVDRGPAVNAILAEKFTGDGPHGYFEDQGYRSYVCAQVATDEWDSVRVCTAHLSLAEQDDHRETECEILRNDILGASDGYVLFAGDVNKKGAGAHCAPSGFHGLKDADRPGDDGDVTAGLQHIYYSANGFWRQTCGWGYTVDETDHKGFLLELGKSAPADSPAEECWRGID